MQSPIFCWFHFKLNSDLRLFLHLFPTLSNPTGSHWALSLPALSFQFPVPLSLCCCLHSHSRSRSAQFVFWGRTLMESNEMTLIAEGHCSHACPSLPLPSLPCPVLFSPRRRSSRRIFTCICICSCARLYLYLLLRLYLDLGRGRCASSLFGWLARYNSVDAFTRARILNSHPGPASVSMLIGKLPQFLHEIRLFQNSYKQINCALRTNCNLTLAIVCFVLFFFCCGFCGCCCPLAGNKWGEECTRWHRISNKNHARVKSQCIQVKWKMYSVSDSDSKIDLT